MLCVGGFASTQEAVQAKLAAASVEEDQDVAAGPCADEAEAADSEEDSVDFGFKKQQPDAQAAKSNKKARPKIGAGKAGNGPSTSTPTKPSAAPGPAKPASNSTEKVEKVVEVAAACDAALKALSPTQYWNGAFKSKDLEAKLAKADSACTSLEKFPAENKACAIMSQLKETIQACQDWSDILDHVRKCKAEPLEVLDMTSAQMDKLFRLPADCVSAVFVDVGRKLVEAGVLFIFIQSVSFRPTQGNFDFNLRFLSRLASYRFLFFSDSNSAVQYRLSLHLSFSTPGAKC